MAVIKCKMCGGDMEISPEKSFGTCEYCGSTMTLPKVSDESTDILDAIRSGYITYVINTMDVRCEDVHTGSSQIRRCAVENGVTVLTSLDTVRVLLDVLEEITLGIATIDE